VSDEQAEYRPPEPPTEPGFYWAYPVWQFGDEYRMIVFVSQGGDLLVAAEFLPEPWLHCRQIIRHDIIRWGPRLDFPAVREKEGS